MSAFEISRRPSRLAARGWIGWVVVLAGLCAVHVEGNAQNGTEQDVAAAMREGAKAMSAGDFSGAIAAYTEATRSRPNLAEGHFDLGLALQQAGRLDDARVELESALHLKPGLRGASLFLGVIAYKQNRFKDAERSLLHETQVDPESAKAFMWLGVSRLALGDPHGAIPPLDKAYQLDPSDADILYHRGRAYLLVANASYDAMFKLDHDSTRVHQVLGEAYAQAYRNQEAISEFELAVKMAPQQPGLHEELGDQYWIAGQLDKVGAQYQEELRIDPYAISAKYKLGSLLVLNQNAAEGVQLLREVLHAQPGLSDAHYYLGTGLMSMNEDQQAIGEFEMAIAADPKSDRAMTSHYKLGQLYRKMQNPTEARAEMDQFLRMRAEVKERQDQHSSEVARKRTELPVEDPERIAAVEAPEAN